MLGCSAVITTMLSINGESPMILPVSGLPSGPPGIIVSRATDQDHAKRRVSGKREQKDPLHLADEH